MKDAVIQLRSKTIVAMILIGLLSLLAVGCSNTEKLEEESVKEFPNRYFILTSGKVGFIDEKGTLVINPKFDDIEGNFSEGLCAVKSDGKWGYIDCSGEFIVNPQYDETRFFSEGIALVKKDGKYGYIDNKGKAIINPQFDKCGLFFEGFAPVLTEEKWGFIDKTGKIIINPDYDNAGHFREGLAAVQFGGRYGFIDTKGQYVINPQYYDVGIFSEGLTWFKGTESADCGYIDNAGQIVINPQFAKAGTFYEGMAKVKIGAKWGYIDKNGKMVINLTYDDADDFSEGLACVKVGEKWGYIDKEGKYVINPQYDDASSFKNGLAPVFKYNLPAETANMSYIDATGKSIWSLDMKESDLPPDISRESSGVAASGDSISIVSLSNAAWKISASSTLQPGANTTYGPELTMDYNRSTAWVEGKPDDGIGEWIMFSLQDNQAATICEIDIVNGYQKSEELYYANNRVKKVRIDFSDGTSTIEELEDHNFGFSDTILAFGEDINYVKITILDVYPGSKYKDTCISEVEFF